MFVIRYRSVAVLAILLAGFSSAQKQENAYADYAVGVQTGCHGDLCNSQDALSIRHHAWIVFSQITRDSNSYDSQSPPVWDTWYLKPETAMRLQIPGFPERKLELPLEIVLPALLNSSNDQKDLKSIKKQMANHVTGVQVKYNPDAFSYIMQENLFDEATLKSKLDGLNNVGIPVSRREIDQFPPRSIIIKAFWLEVPKLGPTLFKLMKPDLSAGNPSTIKVVQAQGRPCNLPSAGTVFTSCFYHVPGSASGSELILVALHVMTKELPDWTWSTFWWHSRADEGPYALGRPPYLASPWRNYLMNTTTSMETPWQPDATLGKSLKKDDCDQDINLPSAAKICFNPYLENPDSSLENAVLSNCMNCHKRATYPVHQIEIVASARRGFLSSENACFANTMRLDYLWSLSRLQSSQSLNQFFTSLQQQLNSQ